MQKQFRSRRSRTPAEKKEFNEHVVQVDRVSRVVAGGRRMRFRVLVVIGNKKGRVGMGLGKADEVSSAVNKAVSQAKRDLITVPIRNDTIPHSVQYFFKSSKLILLPASKGTGIIAGGPVRVVAELAGIRNLLGKTYGSTNKINVTNAAIEALRGLRTVPQSNEQ
jgi:small subunit ribosomal protein S5